MLYQRQWARGSSVLLLGESNPITDRPECALLPMPERSTGWRAWQLIAEVLADADCVRTFSRRDYLRAFWRANACDLPEPRLEVLLEECSRVGVRRVIVLGRAAAQAVRIPRMEWLESRRMYRADASIIEMTLVPHPSGRNRLYNDPDLRRDAGETIVRLAELNPSEENPRT